MSDRKNGPKIGAIILLGFVALNYLLTFIIQFAEFFNTGVSLSGPYVEELVYYEDIWGFNFLEMGILLISVGLLALIPIQGIEMKTKYNMMYGGSILALLLTGFGVLPFRTAWFVLTLRDGFFMPIFIFLFLTLINTVCFLLVVFISKIKLRKLK